jgi:hypothetical protein
VKTPALGNGTERWTFSRKMHIVPADERIVTVRIVIPLFLEDMIMAHKKVERKKELDRRRHRRQERLKRRVREAKAGKA